MGACNRALCPIHVFRHGWSCAAFDGWGQYLRLGIPGMIQMCIEWWSFEICQFLAGILGPAELAVQVAIQTLISVTFMLSVGVSIAVSIRVGNSLGAGDGASASTAAALAISANSAIGVYGKLRHQFYGSFSRISPAPCRSPHTGAV